jgi:hypothetical protein
MPSSNPQLDELRPIVDRCCEAVSKGDNPESIAAYLWSNISAHLVEAERRVSEVEGKLVEAEEKLRAKAEDAVNRRDAMTPKSDIALARRARIDGLAYGFREAADLLATLADSDPPEEREGQVTERPSVEDVAMRIFGDEAPTMVAERLWRARCSGTQEDLPGWDEFTPEERAHKIDSARNLLLAAVFPDSTTHNPEEG